MHDFKFKHNELYCEDVQVADIAKKVATPFYLYSENTIVSHFRKLDSAFSEIPHIICYSLKANSNLAICKTLAKEGCGADVVSGGEIFKALKSNIKPDKIVYAGVGKTEEEIKYAIDTKILMFNIESIPEATLINKVASQKKVKVNVALRINPDVDPDTHSYITTGKKENKFGINIKFAKELFVRVNTFKNLNVCGLHLHIGSQITKSAPYVLALKKAAKLIYSLRDLKINITRYLHVIWQKSKSAQSSLK